MKKRVNVYPCGHKVLIKVDELETETEGGIVLVLDERRERASQINGTIVALGPSAWEAFRNVNSKGEWQNGKPWAKVGDRVFFSKFAGHIIAVNDDEEFTLVNDEDINAIVVEEDS